MKPRILKKLCKKVVRITGDKFQPWLDNKDPFACYYLENTPPNRNSTMTGLWVVGGGLDYWGEACDPRPVYDHALEVVLWEFGAKTMHVMKDAQGNVIDVFPGCPIYPKRLTGKEVIEKLRCMYAAQ